MSAKLCAYGISVGRRLTRALALSAALGSAAGLSSEVANADESGISFWLPGQYGSLAALPQQPGWSLATVYYHTSVSADVGVAAARQVQIGRFTTDLNVNLNATLKAKADLAIVVPSYVFATPVLGGQLAMGMTAIYGATNTSITGTASATLGPLARVRTGTISDAENGFGDLFPQASLRWNAGVHNYMTYVTGGIPVGTYNSNNLANVGIGHGAIDGGAGYTYFNPQTGHEFSAVAGFTHNFKNTSTDYRNGTDFHVDWGASQFLSKQVHLGLVGYLYNQISADSGQPAFLGEFKSRVIAIGPQAGLIFPVGDMQGYLNFKAYKEFDAANRAEGWNAWVTFVISPAAPAAPPPTAKRAMLIK
ncbi:MAG: transporter [Alphaproteobacteria bacterium]|nr:transporter [Alphaproteobacteria bacterium]